MAEANESGPPTLEISLTVRRVLLLRLTSDDRDGWLERTRGFEGLAESASDPGQFAIKTGSMALRLFGEGLKPQFIVTVAEEEPVSLEANLYENYFDVLKKDHLAQVVVQDALNQGVQTDARS